MQLDLVTICVVAVFVTALAGSLLLFSWWQNRAVAPLGFWGASLITGAVGLSLLAGRPLLPPWLSIIAGNAVIALAGGLLWAGFRRFETRPALTRVIGAGALIWLAACAFPEFYNTFWARVVLSSLIMAGYAIGSAAEIWRARAEPLTSRIPIFWLLVIHAIALGLRPINLLYWGDTQESTFFTSPWVISHAFEVLLFSVSMAFLLLGMTKERLELQQRAIASRDPLTGILNRRSFQDEAKRALDRARLQGRSFALLLADLDHFKQINDRFGHGVGDEVLQAFTRTALRVLPTDAIAARLGGEEFAFGLTGTEPTSALGLAERLRAEFAASRFETEDGTFAATVSLGVATSADAGHGLGGLMAAADASLYLAKGSGRNCVKTLSAANLKVRRSPAQLAA